MFAMTSKQFSAAFFESLVSQLNTFLNQKCACYGAAKITYYVEPFLQVKILSQARMEAVKKAGWDLSYVWFGN